MRAPLPLILAAFVTGLHAASAPFYLAEAPDLPGLSAGGFAGAPAFFDDFDPGWEQSQKNWRVATWKQNAAQMDPSRCRTDGAGHLVQTVLAGAPFRGGSLQTDREFGYGRWIARVRPSSVPGLLNSIFTMDWDDLTTTDSQDDGGKSEVDIEFLTHTFGPGRGKVHLAIHLLGRSGFWEDDVELDFNPSDAFHDWGFDILPDRVVWHVDGKILRTWHASPGARIDPVYEMFFNSWTDTNWILGPPARDGDYHIDWVKFFPLKTSRPSPGGDKRGH